jgi:nucleoside-diphosphate-sugar epimerase
MRVLVTGATGFIGGRLVEVLVREHGADVRALVRNFTNASRIARLPVEMVPGDVTDAAAVAAAARGCDVIIHAAMDASGTPRQQHRITVGGTESVLKAAPAASVGRVVHVSTISVYGMTPDGDLTENGPRGRLYDTYSRTKSAAEALALRYHRNHQLPVAVVQPAVVYGPFGGAWTVGPLAALKSSQVVLPNGGNGLCNAVYVDDVVSAIWLAARHPQAVGQSFLISAEQPVTWKDFYGAYEQMLGFQSTVGLSYAELRSLRRSWKRRESYRSLIRLLRSKEFFEFRRKFPLLGVPWEFLKRMVPSGPIRRMRSVDDASSVVALPSRPGPPERPVQLPEPTWFRLLAANTRVRIDKAKQILGYQPKYDLAAGMNRTRRWAEWANLLGKP